MDKEVSDKGEPANDVVGSRVKVRFSLPEGIDKSHIKKTTMRVRRPEDSQSQELEGDVVNSQDMESPKPKILRRSTQTSPVAATFSANSAQSNVRFIKPVWPEPEFDEYQVRNSPREHCNWANSARCRKHRGVPKYGVKEICHTRGEIVSFYSYTFSYSVRTNDSPKRKNELFDMAAKNHMQDSSASGWGSYKKEVKGIDYTQLTLYEDCFDTAKEAENQLAIIQTTRLLAKMAGSKYESKEIRILNMEVALAYKYELDVMAKLRNDHKMILKCKKSAAVDPKLPDGLGRRSIGNDKPGDGEALHYFQGDGIVLYSGRKDGVAAGSASLKIKGPVKEYEDKMGNRVTDYPFLINTKTLLNDAEHIVNFAVYLGHLFKCKTPSDITNDNFICLNKIVKRTSVIDKWPLIFSFSQYFFKVDFSFEQVE